MSEFFDDLSACNYWNGEKPFTGITRPDYLTRINEFLGNRLTKVLMGQRRSGKSYILRQLIADLMKKGVNPHNICYVDKERMEFADLTEANQLHELIQTYRRNLKVDGKVYLFLDEMQEVREWERVVNAYSQDTRNEYEVILTGSNSHLLSSELGTLLTGRYVPFEVFPFSFKEFCTAKAVAPAKESLLTYLKQGGLPELMNLQTEESRRHYVTALRDAILLNDVVRRHRIKDPDLLQRLFRFACENMGSLVSPNKIVAFLRSNGQRTNFETVSNYLAYLCQAMALHHCERYDIRGKELLAGPRKYYLNDLAFREYLSSGFESAITRRLENAVYLHFRAQGWKVHVGTSRNTEVDFVIEKNNTRAYYQVCYLLADEQVIEREYRSLEAIHDSYPKYVLSLDELPLGQRNGIQHQQLWDTLCTGPLAQAENEQPT